jgi:AraC-like DNA-binding protein
MRVSLFDAKRSRLDHVQFSNEMFGVRQDWSAGYRNATHHHSCGQLIYANAGVLDIFTKEGLWVVPPLRAVWMPSNYPHTIAARSDTQFRTIYIRADIAVQIAAECSVLHVSPLLREAILALVAHSQNHRWNAYSAAISCLLKSEIAAAIVEPAATHLPIPEDARVGSIVMALLANPVDPRGRDEWAQLAGASGRTIDRIFTAETGMSFGSWKKQVLLLEALKRLSERQPVALIAEDLGYASPSAFISMFKKSLGITPSKFYS